MKVFLTRSVGYYGVTCRKVSLRLCAFALEIPTMAITIFEEVRLMVRHKRVKILLVSILLVVSVAATKKMQRIARGVWGGQHIKIEVRAKSAAIEYDCASGEIEGPLVVDANGNFKLHGIHRLERGGPVRADEKAKEIPATYTGSIKGETMTLMLKIEGADDETFTLEKGKPGELFKCK